MAEPTTEPPTEEVTETPEEPAPFKERMAAELMALSPEEREECLGVFHHAWEEAHPPAADEPPPDETPDVRKTDAYRLARSDVQQTTNKALLKIPLISQMLSRHIDKNSAEVMLSEDGNWRDMNSLLMEVIDKEGRTLTNEAPPKNQRSASRTQRPGPPAAPEADDLDAGFADAMRQLVAGRNGASADPPAKRPKK